MVKRYQIEDCIAMQIGTIRNLLDVLEIKPGSDEAIPLAVDSDMLDKVLDWCIVHFLEKDEEYKNWSDVKLSPWDIEHFGQDEDFVLKLAITAEYLNIVNMKKMLTKHICDNMKNTGNSLMVLLQQMALHIPGREVRRRR